MESAGTAHQVNSLSQKLTFLVLNRYLAFVMRLYIGGVFIYASLSKISFPAEFAENIASYMLIPYWMVNPVAVVMPWLELICGVLLIVGVRARAAVASIGVMLVIFTVAIAINLWRGTPIGCGCFHALEEPMTWTTLVRDLLWTSMCVYIYYFDSWLQLDKTIFKGIREAGSR